MADTKRFANEGRLTDSLLKKLASEERIPQAVADAGVKALLEDINKPSAEQTTVAEIVYAINNGAKRMATTDLKAQIVALDSVGIDLGKIDDVDLLSEFQAKSTIRSGKAFVQDESEFAQQTKAVRQNWTLGRRVDSYGKDRTTAEGTAQGAAQRGTDAFLKAKETGSVPGLASDAQEVPWPTRGYAGGKVVFTAGSLTILAPDDGKTFLKADHERVRFNPTRSRASTRASTSRSRSPRTAPCGAAPPRRIASARPSASSTLVSRRRRLDGSSRSPKTWDKAAKAASSRCAATTRPSTSAIGSPRFRRPRWTSRRPPTVRRSRSRRRRPPSKRPWQRRAPAAVAADAKASRSTTRPTFSPRDVGLAVYG